MPDAPVRNVPSPQEEASIARWIAELADDSVEVRDAAMGELAKAGRKADKRLKEALKGPNAGLRAGAAHVLAEIERLERLSQFDAGPSLITLKLENAALRQVLEEIRKQARTALSFENAPGDDRVTAAFDRAPLFAALDELCRNHGGIDFSLEEDWSTEDLNEGLASRGEARHSIKATVQPGKYGVRPRACAEQFALRLSSVRMSTMLSFPGGARTTTQFTFEWGWEKGTKPRKAAVRVEELADDLGTSYAEEFKEKDADWDLDEDWVSTILSVGMARLPPEGASKFTVFKGALEVTLPEDTETVAFEGPAEKAGTSQKMSFGEVKLEAYTRKKEGASVRIVVGPEGLEDRVKMRLVDKAGNEYGYRGMSGSGDGRTMTLTLEFPLAEGVEVVALKCFARTGGRVKKVPFEFRDIRIR